MNSNDVLKLKLHRYSGSTLIVETDAVAVEEPLEMSVVFTDSSGIRIRKNISITMRTPGNDTELCLGFLFTEGIIQHYHDIEKTIQESDNSISVHMTDTALLDLTRIERHFYTSSSCGVCGKSSIDSLKTLKQEQRLKGELKVSGDLLFRLNHQVKTAQSVFERTGGLHASALFNMNAELLGLYEDVGRHNALDKLIGSAWMSLKLPLSEHILFLSGRACYELIQKAAMAGVPLICALGAPSSLAIELAQEFNITLVGFLKDTSFNVYSSPERIV